MPPKRMTANPLKPTRYRPGKGHDENSSSDGSENSGAEDEENDAAVQSLPTQSAPPPKATSFPATKIASTLKSVDLNARRAQASAVEAARLEAEKAAQAKEEEGFETEESSGEEEDGSVDEEESEEESSSEDEAPKILLRPTFIKKEKRKDSAVFIDTKTEDEKWAEEEARRREIADELVQAQLERNAAARAAGKKHWDDDEEVDAEEVDDTDGLDPEAERAAWKLRELKRVKREREVIETAEKEREEVERRRNLSKEEREEEDREFLERQKEEQEGRGKMGFMQKYYHKGAFFQDDSKAEGLDRRDVMGSRYADDVANRELLPEYMQIRDMTKLGRKGRTKYKDLKSEDTGKWGADAYRGTRRDGDMDERFRPDRDGGGGSGASGANATQVRERRKGPEGAPDGPRGSSHRQPDSRDQGDNYKPDRDERRLPERRPRSYSRSRSRSPSPRRERRRDSKDRRKRSPSPYGDRYDDKRRRIGV
ncbi:hypothetical protein MMC19_005269 [Ptychographa xylographoides]|nr:hypothetical protein [Ptychographa xylographoides]